MQVDLIKAFDPPAAGSSRSERAGSKSAFPTVFESTMSGGESGRVGNKEGGRAQTPSTRSPSQSPGMSSSAASDRKAVRNDADATSNEVTKAAAESGSVGASASAMVEQGKNRTGYEADSERDGRTTALEDESQKGGLAARNSLAEEGEAPEDGEVSEEAAAALAEAAVANAAEGQAAQAGLEAATAGVAAQPGAGLVEGAPEVASDLRALDDAQAAERAEANASSEDSRNFSDSDSSGRDAEGRDADELALERAAQAAQSGAVNANQRQAVESSEAALRAPATVAIEGATAVASPVAGAVTEITTTATPGAPTPPTASDAISVQTEWLATRGGGTARLLLSPPELGQIAIRVTLRGDAVEVVMVAQEALAKGIAEEQSERLSQAFANRDLRMEHFEVRRGSAADLPNGDGERFAESGAQRDGQANDRGRSGGRLRGSGNAGADDVLAMPRIMTKAPETGVDLRI